jgi:hypothetical protein
MFPDSIIAKHFCLGSDKVAYTINFALAPFFHGHVMAAVLNASAFVKSFDEAFNKVEQRCQMDFIIGYWDESTNQVSSRFLTSVFMSHCSVKDVLESFKKG